jgi:arylsulfatase A-like enzyme
MNFPAMQGHGSVMDPALASLIEDLAESGMLSKTLVVMLSEFGRTPKINKDAGRDHWANVFSCFMAGGGMKGGTVIGSSDEDGYQPKDRPVQVPDIHASVCHALGINPKKEVMTPLQRPMKLVDEASPIQELFA